MRVLTLTFVLIVSAISPSFAQNNIEGMRLLTVNALVQYGRTLYDRGDYDGASAVFNHVLRYDKHQPQALECLKEMGRTPNPTSLTVTPVVLPKVNTVDVADTEAMKKAIEAKKQTIEKLRNQVAQIREDIDDLSAQHQ